MSRWNSPNQAATIVGQSSLVVLYMLQGFALGANNGRTGAWFNCTCLSRKFDIFHHERFYIEMYMYALKFDIFHQYERFYIECTCMHSSLTSFISTSAFTSKCTCMHASLTSFISAGVFTSKCTCMSETSLCSRFNLNRDPIWGIGSICATNLVHLRSKV